MSPLMGFFWWDVFRFPRTNSGAIDIPPLLAAYNSQDYVYQDYSLTGY